MTGVAPASRRDPTHSERAWRNEPRLHYRVRMTLALSLIALLLALPAYAQSPGLVGDWQGTLKAGAAELRLVLHVTASADGALAATMDSPDQGVRGLPVTAIAVKGTSVSFKVDTVRGAYEGTLNASGNEMAGTWTQGPPLPLTLTRRVAPPPTARPVTPSDIDATWAGTLAMPLGSLRLLFHIANSADGLTATMDSPDQNVKGLSVTSVTRTGNALRLELKGIGGTFAGTIANDKQTIDGTWTQAGRSAPLVLSRVSPGAVAAPKRPQVPVPPLPYREEDVTIDTRRDGVTLSGTLTVPAGTAPFPAVVLISGSGPQDRDESLLGHRPFLVLADHLTRQGIAVLRTDDRGTGRSTGTFAGATSMDFANDAEASFAFLRGRREVDPRRVGLVGHSEGGLIAPIIAARNRDVAFIVLLAGVGVPGDQILLAQSELIARASGATPDAVTANSRRLSEILALIKGPADRPTLDAELRARLSDLPAPQVDAQVKAMTDPWMRAFVTYDPVPTLGEVTCPVLALFGEKDLQVPAQTNMAAIRSALAAAGNTDVEAAILPGLNHLFQSASTGAPSEYAQIEETMSPAALTRIAAWIVRQTGRSK